jgi:hypothetical protein
VRPCRWTGLLVADRSVQFLMAASCFAPPGKLGRFDKVLVVAAAGAAKFADASGR